MPNNATTKPIQVRDGTSQQSRMKAALSPDYVSIDERSQKDVLAFVQHYASELKYYDENNQSNEGDDWQGFFPKDIDLDEVIAFINNPDSIPESRAAIYRRPHFVLLLTFIQLLDHSKQHLNTLTQRHLDFYYQQFLKLKKRPAQPDQVNIIIELAKQHKHYHLPKGTQLNGGKDTEGKLLVYKTDKEAFISQAQVTRISSVFVDRSYIGIYEARKQEKGFEPVEQFLAMLKVAIGKPLPGDSLLPFIDTNDSTVDVDSVLLKQLHQQASFVKNTLSMSFSDFNELMRFKNQRIPPEDDPGLQEKLENNWAQINKIVERAGGKRLNAPFTINNTSQAFETNIEKALGTLEFDAEVEHITGLYKKWISLTIAEQTDDNNFWRKFIENQLFMEVDNFEKMMRIKSEIDGEWNHISTVLENAARDKKTIISISLSNGTDFENKLKTIFLTSVDENNWVKDTNKLPPVTSIDQLHRSIKKIEEYFFISAFEFKHIMDLITSESPPSSDEQWLIIENILLKSSKRSIEIPLQKTLYQQASSINNDKGKLLTLLALLIGKEVTDKSILNDISDLKPHLSNNNFQTLLSIAKGINPNNNDSEWERIYKFLAHAWMNINGGTKVPEKIVWNNLYAFTDATTATVSLEIEADHSKRWETFGRKAHAVDTEDQAEIGWAVASPLLFLSEGMRIIILTLELDKKSFDATIINVLTSQIKVVVSTEKGWIASDVLEIKASNKSETRGELTFTLTFNNSADPITAPAHQQHSLPLLKILLNPMPQGNEKDAKSSYQVFKNLVIFGVAIKVKVDELTSLKVQNDERLLDVSKPFEPFGIKPVVGSRFYIAHDEFILKNLSATIFNIEWMNLPKPSLKEHYINYPKLVSDTEINESSFKANISIETMGNNNVSKFSEKNLFNSNKDETKITIKNEIAKGSEVWTELVRESAGIPNKSMRYIQWELLTPDFQHTTYPTIAALKASELAVGISTGTVKKENMGQYVVNPPYTPVIKSLSMGYESESSLPEQGVQAEKFYHVHPFGHKEIILEKNQGFNFLPQYDNEGELYIGIEKIEAPQHLSLLFQMAEGSADANFKPEPVEWSFLSGNKWISLDQGDVLTDGTRGLINSGIIEFSLKPAKPNTLLPSNLYWLRATILKYSNSVCDTVAIHTQAVPATFSDNNNAADHFDQPLATDSIKKLIKSAVAIKGVHQPYTSYGGKAAEKSKWFNTRVSERLRHKNRAVTAWDYEHLVLERFPEIYKAKCLPAGTKNLSCKPGKLVLVVIPDIRERFPFDPFAPKAPASLISHITGFLDKRSSSSASVNVINATFIPVRIRAAVRFRQGFNEGFYKKQLNTDVNRFLSPWAYEEGKDISIGGKIYANNIVNYIDKREYIDYVSNIRLFSTEVHSDDIEVHSDDEGHWISSRLPNAVLVADKQHIFDSISDAGYEEEVFNGIGYMKIQLDFKVA